MAVKSLEYSNRLYFKPNKRKNNIKMNLIKELEIEIMPASKAPNLTEEQRIYRAVVAWARHELTDYDYADIYESILKDYEQLARDYQGDSKAHCPDCQGLIEDCQDLIEEDIWYDDGPCEHHRKDTPISALCSIYAQDKKNVFAEYHAKRRLEYQLEYNCEAKKF